MTPAPPGRPHGISLPVGVSATAPDRPAASGWPGTPITTDLCPAVVPRPLVVRAVIPRASYRYGSQVTTGTATSLNFVPTLAGTIDVDTTTRSRPEAALAVTVSSSAMVTWCPAATRRSWTGRSPAGTGVAVPATKRMSRSVASGSGGRTVRVMPSLARSSPSFAVSDSG